MPVLPTVARYSYRVLNSSRVPQGTVKGVKSFVAVKRFNAVGNWGITCDAASPVNQLLMIPGYYLEAIRTVYDQRTGVVKSQKSVIRGPMLHADFDSSSSLIGATGADDNIWLAARKAWPVNEVYYATLTAATSGLLRWYKLAEQSGTNATDTKSGQTGTYSGTVGYNQRYLADLGCSSIYFNGTNTQLSIPTTSLPTGNNVWSQAVWFVINAYGGGNTTLITMGTSASKQAAAIKLDSTGGMFADVFGTGTTHTGAVAVGTLHQAWATWDGTNLKFYLDGALIQTATPGALNLAYGSAFIGCLGGAERFNGWLHSAEIYNTAVPLATIQANYAAGITRHVKQAYSVRTGVCETALRAYVDDNCTSAAVVDEQGLSRNTGMTLASNGSHGTVVSGSARFDSFIAKDGSGLLQRLALQGGDIGYRVDPNGAGMVFQVYQPNDRSGTVKFSDELGGVSSFAFSRNAPDWEAGGNYIVLGGQGEEELRTFQSVDDSASQSAWGRFEAFQDARDLATRDDLYGRGNQSLSQYSDVETIACTPIQGQNTIWQVDWDLGDIVTVRATGITIVDKVRSIEVELDGTVEKVTPRIGVPGTEYSDTQDVVLTSGKYTDLKVHARLAALEARK